jgi:hypothetical protein
MEHFFDRIQGWFDYQKMYGIILDSCPDEGFSFVEVGVWKGRSLAFFAVESVRRRKTGRIFAVDHWIGSAEHRKGGFFHEPLLDVKDGLFNRFLRNMEPVAHLVEVVRKPSLEAAEGFGDASVDAVFIDASHDYRSVFADLGAWTPKVRAGGILAGHDYDWPGVREAVAEFAAARGVGARQVGSCWMLASSSGHAEIGLA